MTAPAHPPRQASKPAMPMPRRKVKQRNYDRAQVAKHTLGRAPKPSPEKSQ
jgi:hypothetical protein